MASGYCARASASAVVECRKAYATYRLIRARAFKNDDNERNKKKNERATALNFLSYSKTTSARSAAADANKQKRECARTAALVIGAAAAAVAMAAAAVAAASNATIDED